MKIDLDWIQKELDAGKEVIAELEDPNGLRGCGVSESYIQEWLNNDVSIRAYNYIYFITSNGVGIPYDNLMSFFRIKRPTPTFNDLIDVAVQAYKDGVLSEVDLGDNGVYLTGLGVISSIGGSSMFQDAINDINSLYTETFVIESEEDYNKFKGEVNSLVLANGEDIIDDVMFHRCYPYFTTDMVGTYKLPFKLLKGATVTQKR